MNEPMVSCTDFPMMMDTAMLHTLDLNLYTQRLQLPLDLVNIRLRGPVVLTVKKGNLKNFEFHKWSNDSTYLAYIGIWLMLWLLCLLLMLTL